MRVYNWSAEFIGLTTGLRSGRGKKRKQRLYSEASQQVCAFTEKKRTKVSGAVERERHRSANAGEREKE